MGKIYSREPDAEDMAFVYSLQTDGLCWYVGSTTDVKSRWKNHKGRRTNGAAAIPLDYEFDIKQLEDCDISERWEREKYWIGVLCPLYNKNVPGRNHKEWVADNRNHRIIQVKNWHAENREHEKKYRAANRERFNARRKAWREAKRLSESKIE